MHLSGVVLLAPHPTDDNVDELIAAASQQTKAEIAVLLAARRPRPDVPTRLEAAPAQMPLQSLAPGPRIHLPLHWPRIHLPLHWPRIHLSIR